MTDAPERIWAYGDSFYVETNPYNKFAIEYVRADRIEQLEAELLLMQTAGIVEVSIRNPSVMEYMRHWEDRAETAEAKLDDLQDRLDTANKARAHVMGMAVRRQAKLAECLERNALLEARLGKAVEALRYYAVEAMPWEADDSLVARTTLAEIEGEKK